MIVNAQLWGKVLVCYLIAVNVLAFALMGIDKHKARCGAWRISEKALFLPVLLGGGVGGCLGMRAFRHKTKHWYFRFGFPLIALLWLALIVWLMSR